MSLATLASVLDFLLTLSVWVISVSFGLAFPAIAAAMAKKYLINENRFKRKKFVRWTRIMLFIAPLFSSGLLQIARFGSEIYWEGVGIVIIAVLAIMYYPDTIFVFVDLTTVLLDHLVAFANKLRRIQDGNK